MTKTVFNATVSNVDGANCTGAEVSDHFCRQWVIRKKTKQTNKNVASPGRHSDCVSLAPSQRRDGLQTLFGQEEKARKEHRASSKDGQHDPRRSVARGKKFSVQALDASLLPLSETHKTSMVTQRLILIPTEAAAAGVAEITNRAHYQSPTHVARQFSGVGPLT